jgi:hypothetical protein
MFNTSKAKSILVMGCMFLSNNPMPSTDPNIGAGLGVLIWVTISQKKPSSVFFPTI